ncbi:uncharacterized protein LOC120914263 [Rana temporaria]|uniref:uncharacterized protein LOC120914263 n=1 Tax=Rana temporaria TaxID=8407 RepID=UPI001AAC4B42|nr:uncharacterized protein LOC120914263 [Rana temporaria]
MVIHEIRVCKHDLDQINENLLQIRQKTKQASNDICCWTAGAFTDLLPLHCFRHFPFLHCLQSLIHPTVKFFSPHLVWGPDLKRWAASCIPDSQRYCVSLSGCQPDDSCPDRKRMEALLPLGFLQLDRLQLDCRPLGCWLQDFLVVTQEDFLQLPLVAAFGSPGPPDLWLGSQHLLELTFQVQEVGPLFWNSLPHQLPYLPVKPQDSW